MSWGITSHPPRELKVTGPPLPVWPSPLPHQCELLRTYRPHVPALTTSVISTTRTTRPKTPEASAPPPRPLTYRPALLPTAPPSYRGVLSLTPTSCHSLPPPPLSHRCAPTASPSRTMQPPRTSPPPPTSAPRCSACSSGAPLALARHPRPSPDALLAHLHEHLHARCMHTSAQHRMHTALYTWQVRRLRL